MFRKRSLNPLIPLLLLLAISFMNCDGRIRKHRSSAEILTESNLINAFSNQPNFIPKQPVKIETDTILSNGFRIKLDYYSNKNLKKANTEQTNHYNFEAILEVLFNDERINTTIINKHLFKDFESSSFFDKAIMQFVWIDHEASTGNSLYLKTSFRIPETDIFKDYAIIINDQGYIQIEPRQVLPKTV